MPSSRRSPVAATSAHWRAPHLAPSHSTSGRTSPAVAALRLRDLLRSDIVHGAFPDGLLPSEPELMLVHRATRATVRQALALLCREGVVARRQGIGTVVTSRVVATRLVEAHGVERPDTGSSLMSIDDARPVLFDGSLIECPTSVARLLDAGAGEQCARIEYAFSSASAEGVLAVCTNYVLLPEGRALLATSFRGNWYTYLDDAGVELGDDDFLIGALAADEGLAERLAVRRGDPLLYMEQVIRDSAGRAFNAAYIYLRADRIMLLSHAAMPPKRRGGRAR